MKVTCQSCQAKYTIADEKVRGKVAKIRCKKCGTTIIVGGAEGQSSEPPVAESAAASVDEQWTIVVAEGDERQVAATQIATLYAAGTITDATVAWKQGMPDWLPLAEIPELRTIAESLRPSRLPVAAPSVAPPADVNTSMASARSRVGDGGAARRVGRAAGADLFGASGDDVTTSASASPAGARPIEDRPTGARNENSVLFSLSALTGGGAPAPATGFARDPETNSSSSRADLSSLVRGAEKPAAPAKNKLDDIMNLGGGGLYSPALMAPSLSAPSVEFPSSDAPASGAKGKTKGFLMVGVGAAVILGGAVAAFSAMRSNTPDGPSATASAGAHVQPMGNANAPVGAAPRGRAARPPIVAAAPTLPGSAEPTSAATTMTPGQVTPKPEVEKRPVAAAPKSERAERPTARRLSRRLLLLGQQPPAPAAASTADFDRAAALSVLSAAATASQSCKKPDGPTGGGRVSVTFANNGSATTAMVEGPPFAGTPVGGCVAARFRSARVPAFSGSAVTVHKSFNIN